MKVLGFVNRYSRGVQAVQEELRTNGNGEADFKLHLGTAFLVVEKITKKKPIKETTKPIKETTKPIKETAKPIKETTKPIKETTKPIKETTKPIKEPVKPKKEPKKALQEVLSLMRDNPKVTYKEMEELLGIKRSAIFERVKKLKTMGLLKREGGRSSGIWIIVR